MWFVGDGVDDIFRPFILGFLIFPPLKAVICE